MTVDSVAQRLALLAGCAWMPRRSGVGRGRVRRRYRPRAAGAGGVRRQHALASRPDEALPTGARPPRGGRAGRVGDQGTDRQPMATGARDRPVRAGSRRHAATAGYAGLSSLELAEAVLRRLEATEPTLNAFITVLGDAARAAARQADDEIARGDRRGTLHGIPVTIKDMFDTAGVRTTGASENPGGLGTRRRQRTGG